jgi:hypothetical protein
MTIILVVVLLLVMIVRFGRWLAASSRALVTATGYQPARDDELTRRLWNESPAAVGTPPAPGIAPGP